MISKLVSVFIFFSSAIAFGQHEAEVDPHAIPWRTLGVQTFNVVLLCALLIYLLRKAVIEHFQGRLTAYRELVDRAETAKNAAQKSHREISQKLQELQNSADASLQTAKTEAAALKQKLMSEAQVLAKKLEADAKHTVEIEIEKAKGELRSELLNSALETTRESLKKTVGSSEQMRLQTEFVDKIQVVGQ